MKLREQYENSEFRSMNILWLIRYFGMAHRFAQGSIIGNKDRSAGTELTYQIQTHIASQFAIRVRSACQASNVGIVARAIPAQEMLSVNRAN